ncbi:uncharacterized protein [Blastocystis hominis]|uniref:Uncharacterized protein n=1 Tax=Blastocystis hominis TaxID=12968 RepID=D8M7G0_BLAHO|nr:uncharacterized protein [Blastocystis hominis]CBK23999.2 unnamed protein product [Blastocystis hominis]|eukprot:XP_012898047.1 uncharacterized protein [Blastocystis hominis]
MLADSFSHKDHDHGCNEESNEEHLDGVKEEVVVNITEMSIKKLRSSVYGLCLHSLFDGLVVGSSVISANVDVIQTIFWAILLHKISAALGVGIFIRQLHISYKQALRYICWFSAATPLSTIFSSILVLFSSSYIPSSLLGYAFAFSAGTFLHVSLMHILPSIGSHVGFVQVGFILIGVLIPYLLFTEHSH